MASVWRWAKDKAREASYFVSGKTEVQKMVLEATNSDPWGPANSVMGEIARHSMNYSECEEIKECLWERMSDPSEIRHVQKSLLLLEFLLRNGHESFRSDARCMMGHLQSFTHLQRYETGEEAALEAVIRKKAKDLINLLNDNELYQAEREKAKKLKSSLVSVSNSGGSSGYGYSYGNSYQDDFTMPSSKPAPPPVEESESYEEEELDFDPRNPSGKPQSQQTQQFQQPQQDPFGFNTQGQAQQQQQTFDPFGGQQAQTFDPFGSQKPQNQTFDPFGGSGIAPPPGRQQQPQGGILDLNFSAPQPKTPQQPAPAFDDLLSFTPTQQPATQPVKQQDNLIGFGADAQSKPKAPPKKSQMFSEFGDLVDLDLKGGQQQASHGKAKNQVLGNGPAVGTI